MNHPTVVFIGAGNMASSLIQGLLAAGHPASNLRAADPMAEQRSRLATLGIATFTSNDEACADADVIVLAIKPQVMAAVLRDLTITPGQLLISIAAGVTLDALAALTPAAQPIVRCMPNTPALLQAGISGLYANAAVAAEQRDVATRILQAAGSVVWLDAEADLDAVTAVSGSGPAYFFYLMEAMIRAGESLGLSREVATRLTVATAEGAAMMAATGDAPAQLRINVTSPGGTTQQALSILDGHDTQQHLYDAVIGAAHRSQELGTELAKEFTTP